MAIVTNYVVFIVVFVVGIPYYRLAIFTIEFINYFNCTKGRALSTREHRPAECAKRLNKKQDLGFRDVPRFVSFTCIFH